MVLLLETAAALEARARRSTDPAQARVLLERAEQRRAQSEPIREWLGLHGAPPGGHEPRVVYAGPPSRRR